MIVARCHRASGTRFRRLTVGIAAGLALAALMNAGPLRADSTTFRGNSGLTGTYGEKVSVPLSLSWRYTADFAPYDASSPASVGDTIYFSAGDRFYAVDASTGALKWKYPQDEPMSTTVTTSPAIAENMVYLGCMDGKLIGIHADSGKYAWAFDTKSSIGSSPTVVDGIIYFGSADGRIWAIDSKTGDSVPTWRGGFKVTDEVSGAPAVANGIIYALSLDQVLYAINASSAKLRWSYRTPGTVRGMNPVAIGDYVVVASGSNLSCLIGRNGNLKWLVQLPADIIVNPAVTESAIYVVCGDDKVYAIDLRTGHPLWHKAPVLDYDVIAPPSISGNTLFVGTAQGGIYAINTDDGSVTWTYTIQPSTRDTSGGTATNSNTGGMGMLGGPGGRTGPGAGLGGRTGPGSGLGGRTGGTNNDGTLPAYANIAAAPVFANQSLLILSDDGSLSCFRSEALDTVPPTVEQIMPEMGIVINGAPPIHFEAKVTDEGSGVNPDTVKILIDGEGVAKRPEGDQNYDKPGYRYDPVTDILDYDTPEPQGAAAVRPMEEGRHTVTVVASDWKGNTVNRTWCFTVDNSIARSGRKPRTNTNTNNGLGGGNRNLPGGGMGSGGMGRGGGGSGGMGRGRGGGGGGLRGGGGS